MRKRILFNGLILARPKTTGIGRYALDILNLFNEYGKGVLEISVCKPKAFPFYRTLWEHLILPAICWIKRPDILFCPAFVAPLFPIPRKTKLIVVIHDLKWKHYPQTMKWFLRSYLDLMVFISLKRADLVLADSSFVKDDIIKHFSFADKKTITAHIPIDTGIFFNSNSLRKKQILYVGSIALHKNIKGILTAFGNVHKKIEHKLIIVGSKEFSLPSGIDEILKKLPRDRIEFLGYLPDKDIVRLYNESDFFVFPSLFEGYGLPPLEAMACGCPVITSSIEPIKELCADAALYCDPLNYNDIAEKILSLANNAELKNKLRNKGTENIKRFKKELIAKSFLPVVLK